MTFLTADNFANQMVAQARVLDPSFSGEIGTPERKIIDTVAQALADNQIDLTGLSGALDIDSKFGSNLDRFTALFGMQRQQPTFATGYVDFSRNSPAPAAIVVPAGTVIQSNGSPFTDDASGNGPMQYTTTASGIIEVGETDTGAVPIQCAVSGVRGNTGANTITVILPTTTGNTTLPGITAVTNPNALTNGLDAEDDNSFKVRFKNTWARNLAGTEDQFLALALAGTFSTKAVVLGVQSRFQEYIQVPDFDDAGFLNGSQTEVQNVGGVQNQWTTALSDIAFAQSIYDDTQVFISSGQTGTSQVFYTPDVDFTFNAMASATGDVLRNNANTTITSVTLPTINVPSTAGFTPQGLIAIGGASGQVILSYTGTTDTSFTGCVTLVGRFIALGPPEIAYQVPSVQARPNFTFINVFNPASPITIDGLQALSPGDVVLSEFSYLSSSSRNNLARHVTNCVDVFVDGSNDVQTSCIVLPNVVQPPTGGSNTSGQPSLGASPVCSINTTPTSPWYYESFRRDGEPTKRPQLFNLITPLFQSPIDALPNSIILNSVTLNLGEDYWLIREIGDLEGSIRSRDGIEWNRNSSVGNNIVTASLAGNIPLEVSDYTYDANIPVLQQSMEAEDLVSFDILVHQARKRYFKLDLTIMCSPNVSIPGTQAAIATSVQALLDNQYFGTVIQLSDLLEATHDTPGVDNVRWSNDLTLVPDLIRVVETDIDGNPLHGVTIDRWLVGTVSITAQDTLTLVGNPHGTALDGSPDSFSLTWTDGIIPGGHMTTADIPFWHLGGNEQPVTASDIQTAVRAVGPGSGRYHNITITEDAQPSLDIGNQSIRTFTITYNANGVTALPTVTESITESDYAYDADFFLQDNELPTLPLGQVDGDTLPGLILRTRAQNTFIRPGLG